MLYTRKGDKGDTSAFGCNQRFSKNSALAEALGNVDEINSLLGICKVKSLGFEFQVLDFKLDEIIEQIQQDLFIIQELEKQLSPVKSFFISGGAELSALFDYSRAVSRRAERRVVAYSDSEKGKLAPEILAYLNRLSSLLYALARAANLKSGQKEKFPSYE